MKKLAKIALVGSLSYFMALPVLADLNDGLIAHYPFNGNANDISGNNITAITNVDDLTLGIDTLELINKRDGDPRRSLKMQVNSSGFNKLEIESYSYYTAEGNHTLSGITVCDNDNDGCEGFNIRLSHNNYHYSGTNGLKQYDNREHVWLGGWQTGDDKYSNSFVESDLLGLSFGVWIKERIVIDYINNSVDYYRDKDNGLGIEHITLSETQLKPSKNTSIHFNAWDWANGSKHIIDYIKIYGFSSSCDVRYDEGYTAGKQACKADPASCGISSGGTPISNCMANYFTDGQLHVPCVAVSDPFGGKTIYDIMLNQQAGSFTFDLDMGSVKSK